MKAKKRSKAKGVSWKKFGLFAPIQTPDKALMMLKQASTGFYFIAGIHGVLGLFSDRILLVMGFVYAILGYLLQTYRSRIIAVCLAFVASVGFLINEADRHGMDFAGKTNIFFSFIVFVIAIRVVEAAFKFQGKVKERPVHAT